MLKVLHIDDDANDVRLFREAIRECSVPVDLRAAADGLAGLELLRETALTKASWRPDVIVCDLNMARMDGHAFLGAMKADRSMRRIPVILLSSSRTEEDVVIAYDEQANCFIRKPLEFSDLCEVARRIVAFWSSTAELPKQEGR